MKKGDRYIRDQLEPLLAYGEKLEHTGYFTTQTGDSMLTAAKAKGYLVGLTDQRLFTIETRIGAFRPLLENRGVESIALIDIDSVSIKGAVLSIALKSGSRLAFTHKKGERHFAGQAGLRQALLARFAREGSAAEAASKHAWRKSAISIGIGIAIAGGLFWLRWKEQSEVNLRCQQLLTGISCELSQDGGRSSISKCWNLTIECRDGGPRKLKQCTSVEPDSVSTVVLSANDIPRVEQCGQVTDFKVRFLDD